jgi:hypothetical protein
MRRIHLINEDGNKKVVDSDMLNEMINNDYNIDVNWYLSHGYMKFEDVTKEIEYSYYDVIND